MNKALCACVIASLVGIASVADAQPRRRPPRTTPVRRRPRRPVPVPEVVIPEHEPAPAMVFEEPEPTEPVAPPPPPPPPRPMAFEAVLGLRVFTRSLAWNDDLFNELRPYSLSVAPALSLRVNWFPGAHFTASTLANLGLTASAEIAMGLSSNDAAGHSFDTSASQWSLGVRWRIPVDDVTVGVTAEYLSQRFVVDLPRTDDDLGVPAMQYGALALGADARFAISSKLAVNVGARYLAVLSAGAIGDTVFPEASAGGFDLEAGVAYSLGSGLDLRLSGGVRRYFFSLNPLPGDRWVAGGATDDYLSALLALGYRR